MFFSNSRDGRNVAINTFMEQLYQCADITLFFSRKITMITNVILIFLQQFYKCKVNEEIYVLDTTMPVFALFRQQKSFQTQSQHCFASLSNMTVIRS